MNLFILDEDHDRNAEYHIDKHVGKMQLEAAQLLATALWVDREFGFVPRALNSDELAHLRNVAANEPPIDERTFVRYLPSHHNHPCSIWVRSSLGNFYWTQCYVNALNEETMWRGNKSHASCAEVNKMPEPKLLTGDHMTPFALAMPDAYKTPCAVTSYRQYYMNDKAGIASWKKRGQPEWWNNGTL